MKAVVQRVSGAAVRIDGSDYASIGPGLLILLAVTHDDTEQDVAYLAEKCSHLRIFADDRDKMNRSILDIGGSALVVSQFTLYGDTRRGRRPSFISAARPDHGRAMYEKFVERLRQNSVTVATGKFGAMMDVTLTNQGPVTLILDSQESPHRR